MTAGEQGVPGIARVMLGFAFDDDDVGGGEQFLAAHPAGVGGAAVAGVLGVLGESDELEVGGLLDQPVFVGEVGVGGSEEADPNGGALGVGGGGGDGLGPDRGGGEGGEEVTAVERGRLGHGAEYGAGKRDSKRIFRVDLHGGSDGHLPREGGWLLIVGVRWRKAAILGVGLLGGSLGMALRRRGLAGEVYGLVRREVTAKEAVEVGAVDAAGGSLKEAISGADLVVLCTPVAQMAGLVHEIGPWLEGGACVTDVGSVKGAVVAAAEGPIGSAGGRFVGSHPMAGSERTGVTAAREDLFCRAVTVVTPTAATDGDALARVKALWEGVGARVLTMTPAHHDVLVSRSSHLPHLVAATLARYVLAPEHPAEQACLCATGFRDTTRVASGSPEMWRDIALGNRSAILAALDDMQGALAEFRQLLEAGNGSALEDYLRTAKERRDAWCGRGMRSSPE